VTLAQNFPSEAEVDAAWERALRAGATAVKPPQAADWGGYSGYFADPTAMSGSSPPTRSGRWPRTAASPFPGTDAVTVSAADLGLYAVGLFLLWLTPGPVWVAITARALSRGFRGAWPLAVGVTVGDVLWPLCAILGVSWILSVWEGFLDAMVWVAAATFVVMGALVIRSAGRPIGRIRGSRGRDVGGLRRGVAAILANPKAILFYMGMLPGFFDVTRLTGPDIAAILLVSMAIPLVGNLLMALLVDRARSFLGLPRGRPQDQSRGGGLARCVGLAIPLL
jgi:threonine/homoserine/homoserine lactone efflux protein